MAAALLENTPLYASFSPSQSPPASMWELKFESRANSVVQVAAITVSFLFRPSTLSRIVIDIDSRWGLIPVLGLSRYTWFRT